MAKLELEAQGCTVNIPVEVDIDNKSIQQSIKRGGILMGFCPRIHKQVYFNVGKDPNNITSILCEYYLCDDHAKP